ncbi:hypothetical protein AMECASPLE_038172 [Ameca splendens]|uniref:Uncharacterized protein n=1 Tax=Ameca splendens TaxID=208324 RepID=A0ABV0ZHX0_9TELE
MSKQRTQPPYSTCCSLPTPLSSQPPRSPPRHNSQQSNTPPSLPNHSASTSNLSPSVRERETCTSRVTGSAGQPLQAKHIPPAASMQAQDMLQRPTHPTANRSPAPGQGQEPQKEALEEDHHSTPRTGHPTNPTTKPRRCPRMPATHPPAWHPLPH